MYGVLNRDVVPLGFCRADARGIFGIALADSVNQSRSPLVRRRRGWTVRCAGKARTGSEAVRCFGHYTPCTLRRFSRPDLSQIS